MKQLRLDNWVDAKSNVTIIQSFFESMHQHLLDSFPTNLSFATSPSSKVTEIHPFLYITQVTFRTQKNSHHRCYWGNKRFELRSQGAGDDAWTTHCEGRVEQSGGGARAAEEVDAQCLWWTWWLHLMGGVGLIDWRTFGGEKDGGEIHEHFTHYQHVFFVRFSR